MGGPHEPAHHASETSPTSSGNDLIERLLQRSNRSAPRMDLMMFQSDDDPGAPRLDFEGWRDLLRKMGGRYYSEGTEPDAFAGWVCPVSACGFTALDIGCNADRIERTYRDTRLD